MNIIIYLAVSHIYESRFHFLNMVKMLDVNTFDLKDKAKHL